MTKRQGISKSVRFEVFKRDKFTCQYCGRTAPNIVLQLDHIHPVAKGGDNDITNLVTSCAECNAGKSDKTLSDDSAISKRKAQLDDLAERREQIEMMLQWQMGLSGIEDQEVDAAGKLFESLVPGYSISSSGDATIRKLIKSFGLHEIMECTRISVSQYLVTDSDGAIDQASVYKAWDYVERIAKSRKREQDRPYLKDLYYARAILRNRVSYVNEGRAMQILERAHRAGVDVEEIHEIAKQARNWTLWLADMEDAIQAASENAPTR